MKHILEISVLREESHCFMFFRLTSQSVISVSTFNKITFKGEVKVEEIPKHLMGMLRSHFGKKNHPVTVTFVTFRINVSSTMD